MKTRLACTTVFVVLSTLAYGNTASAIVLASTDFDGRTVSGDTASNLTWITDGIQDPGDLTVVDEDSTGFLGGLFDTTDAQDRFVPDMNIQNEGPWSVTIPIAVTTTFPQVVVLRSVAFDFLYFSNAGDTFTSDNRPSVWDLTLTGSTSGVLETGSSGVVDVVGGASLIIPFSSPVLLTELETYELKLEVVSPGELGVNAGIDNLALNGDLVFVPEPSTAALTGFGLACLAARRRRRR